MVVNATRPLCKSARIDGQPCRAPAIKGGFCFSHSPELAEKAKEARVAGGRNKAKAIRLRKLVPPRLLPVFDKLENALDEVHRGNLEPRVATAMASLAAAMVRVLTAGEIEDRVRRLEEANREGDTDEP
jgi:hypothetical protein